jgi:putative transposase
MSALVEAGGRNGGVAGACQVLALSRASYYRSGGPGRLASAGEMAVRDALQRAALTHPCYGYRRLTHELQRQGHAVNHKRVLRLMRQDNLLCLRRRSFVVTTQAGGASYPNLAAELTVTAPNQLWVADLTYLRLQREWVYLAVVLDAYSRRCIGWALGRRLTERLALEALELALATRPTPPGLVHHSDRGVQYGSRAYTGRLQEVEIAISMSRSGNPYDNAYAESFLKTLKYEEVYLSDYRDEADLRESLAQFLEEYYNRVRLHSALGYAPPAEFEAHLAVTMAVTP